jgi:hypothetical protein
MKCLSRGWSAMSEEGEMGLNTKAQKLAVTVLSRASSVLPTRCRYYEGCLRNLIVLDHR